MAVVPWAAYRAARRRDSEGVDAMLRLADDVGIDRREFAWVIEKESGWRPNAQGPAPEKAAGLIQILNSNLRRMGAPLSDEFVKLSIDEQLPWYRMFLNNLAPVKKGDFYLELVGVQSGVPDEFVVIEAGTPAWFKNTPLHPPGGGHVLAGHIRALGAPPDGGGPGTADDRIKGSKGLLGGGTGSGLAWLVLIGLLLSKRRG